MEFKQVKAAFGDISNWKWFVLLSILIRGAMWLYLGYLVNLNLPGSEKLYSYFIKDDYAYFFDPVDNFLKTGTFSYFNNIPFTGRMPGYSIVYLLFRFIFSKQIAAYCVVGTQFLLSSVSVYILALTSYKIFNSKRVFYVTFCLYILAVFPGFFDLIIVPESFSVSSLIFTFYFLVCYLKEGYKTKYLILSGAFLTWTIFLREYTGLLIIIFPIVLCINEYFILKRGTLKAIKVVFLFCLPFIAADSLWVTRNYIDTGKFIPLESATDQVYGKLYSPSWSAIDNLVYTWGENGSPFNLSGIAYYFRVPSAKNTFKFPQHLFNNVSTYNVDSLIHLRQLYGTFYYTKDTVLEKATQNRILFLTNLYKHDYISHNYLSYILVKPIKGHKYFLLFSGTGYLPMPPFSKCNSFEKAIKILFSILYFVVLICANAGILKFILKERSRNNMILLLMLMSILMITGVIIFYSSAPEPRYSVHIFMICVIFASSFIGYLLPQKIDD